MQVLIIGMTILNILLIALISYGVPESPKFLFEKERIEEFKEALKWMAKVNGIQVNIDEIVASGYNTVELPQIIITPQSKMEELKEEEDY